MGQLVTGKATLILEIVTGQNSQVKDRHDSNRENRMYETEINVNCGSGIVIYHIFLLSIDNSLSNCIAVYCVITMRKYQPADIHLNLTFQGKLLSRQPPRVKLPPPIFRGTPGERPEAHLLRANDWMDTYNILPINKPTNFKHTLDHLAREWYNSLTFPITWNDL